VTQMMRTGAGDRAGVEVVALAVGEVDHWRQAAAADDAEGLVGEELGGQVLVVGGDELGRAAPALRSGHQRRDGSRHRAQLRLHRRVERERLAVGLVTARPATSGRQRHNRLRPPARPRAASCSATKPPSELPTRCAVAKPAASIARSTASGIVAASTGLSSGGPPAWPISVSASTSWWRSNVGSTNSQVRHVSVKPCRHTSGVPEPRRCAGVKREITRGG
jgi:hypothetical protein